MLTQRQKEALEFVELVLDSGYRAFLAERGTYGFYTDAEGSRVVSFQIDCPNSVSGNYRPVNVAEHGRQLGTGWRIMGRLPESKKELQACFDASAPLWATQGLPVTLVTLEQHLKTYQQSSRYTEIGVKYVGIPAE